MPCVQSREKETEVTCHHLMRTALGAEDSPVLDGEVLAFFIGLTRTKDVQVPESLRSVLRPYQVTGFQFLVSNALNGFGSMLADDMGLGKTLQVIAFLLYMKEGGHFPLPVLVVVPLSLMQMWTTEVKKWAPRLRINVFHRDKRQLPGLFPLDEAGADKENLCPDIIVTTYASLSYNVKQFAGLGRFSCLILDESQTVKNSNIVCTHVVKLLAKNSSMRISISGTPVENSLSDLYSQFDFLMPGFLSDSQTNFVRKFSQHDGNAHKSRLLRQLIKPFFLRRLKTDTDVAALLPAKVERTYECVLTRLQTALYMAVEEGIKRVLGKTKQGPSSVPVTLSMVHSLREVCNHPANLSLKRWPASISVDRCPPKTNIKASGKCRVLMDILSTILTNGEKTLIYCQYVSTIDILAEQIQSVFGIKVLKFVGTLEEHCRQNMVDEFQTNKEFPVMILSIGVGCLGLTLTAATHVIHFDRCFNPMRERQATDRAHRIGQSRTVFVHTLISSSTFERRLSDLMEQKQQLCSMTIEDWLPDLPNEKLLEVLSLSPAKAGDSLPDAVFEHRDLGSPDAKRLRKAVDVD